MFGETLNATDVFVLVFGGFSAAIALIEICINRNYLRTMEEFDEGIEEEIHF